MAKQTEQAFFLEMLDNIKTGYEIVPRETYLDQYTGTEYYPDEGVAVVVRVLPGYRAHFEATFDKDGAMLSIGQWETM